VRSPGLSSLISIALCGCGRVGFDSRSNPDAASEPDAASQPDAAILDAALPNDLVAYWKFDELSGTSAIDATGHGHTLTLMNGASWTAGKFGGAVASDGVDDYLVTPLVDLSATSAVTLSLWANRTYTNGPNHTLAELSSNINSFQDGFGLFPDDLVSGCAGLIFIFVRGNVGNAGTCYTQPTSGTWHHLVVVYDKSKPAAEETALFIDGIRQTPVTANGVSDNTNNFGALPFYLFARGGIEEFNPGVLDEVKIFERALTPAEIIQL
jgi:hypothetical protein